MILPCSILRNKESVHFSSGLHFNIFSISNEAEKNVTEILCQSFVQTSMEIFWAQN